MPVVAALTVVISSYFDQILIGIQPQSGHTGAPWVQGLAYIVNLASSPIGDENFADEEGEQ